MTTPKRKRAMEALVQYRDFYAIEAQARRRATPEVADASRRASDAAAAALTALAARRPDDAMLAILQLTHHVRHAAGCRMLPSAQHHWRRMGASAKGKASKKTERVAEALQLHRQGLTQKEIAAEMKVTRETVSRRLSQATT
jgi:DNA-binding NarL/FixJ family response regulator